MAAIRPSAVDNGPKVDAEPDVARRKRFTGIADGYYCGIAPDPTKTELERILITLRELAGVDDAPAAEGRI